MRIVAEIPHHDYKITVFSMNNKLSIKLESRLLEQTFKFRDGSGMDSIEDIEKLLTPAFLDEVEKSFQIMARARQMGIQYIRGDENEFPVIV